MEAINNQSKPVTVEILNKYAEEASKLLKLNSIIREQKALFKLAMEDFITRVIKERFPDITEFECEFYENEPAFGMDWDNGPTTEEVNLFMDETNKQFKFHTL